MAGKNPARGSLGWESREGKDVQIVIIRPTLIMGALKIGLDSRQFFQIESADDFPAATLNTNSNSRSAPHF